MATQLQARLADARDKYHLLLTGQAPRVVVDQNGERVEFNTASAARLAEYISQLEAQANGNNLKARRPLGFVQ